MSASAKHPDPYLSPNPLEVTHHLTNLYIANVAKSDASTAALLTDFRNKVWPLHGEPISKAEQQAFAERMIHAGKEHHYEAQKALLTGMMRLGQLYDVAALVARGNAFDENRRVQGEDRVADSTGGVENFFEILIRQDKSKKDNDLQYTIPFDGMGRQPGTILKDALDALSKPVFEIVMTTHPTNVNALDSLKQLRNLGKAIHAYRKAQNEADQTSAGSAIEASLEALATVDAIPMVNRKGAREPGNIPVRGEVDMVLFYLQSMYDDLPQVYRGFEQPIHRLIRKNKIPKGEVYDRLNLKLNIRASAWGLSGDKDGNQNVNADTTLEALLATKVTLLGLYLRDMDGLSDAAKKELQPTIDQFTKDKAVFEQALNEVEGYLHKEVSPEDGAQNKSRFLPPHVFDDIVARLPKTRLEEPKKFVEKLETLCRKLSPVNEKGEMHPDAKGLLTFIRRVRSFGYHFAKIEYRETAEEYARVVSTIIPEYGDLHKKDLELKAELKQLEDTVELAAQRSALQESLKSVKEAALQLSASSALPSELKRIDSGAFSNLIPDPTATREKLAREQAGLAAKIDQLDSRLSSLRAPVDIEDAKSALQNELDRIEAQKRLVLTNALNGHRAKTLLAKKLPEIIEKGKEKAYSSDDPMPIAYQTIKRMELAREFPEMITANVLAECQNTSNILEAVFLQAACAGDKGKRPKMGVVPLFEEPDTMKRIDKIMEGAYLNTAYSEHMDLVAKHLTKMGWTAQQQDDPHVQKRQQVQIAHSDNARRSGFLAARAFIDEAHIKLRALNEKHGIKTEFFEGGSISDAYRGGVRSISAAVNEYGLHDFMKFTFQGGDLPNYFGSPGSTVRLFTRNLAHAAKQFLGTSGHSEPTDIGANLDTYNKVAQTALKNTLPDYQRNIFNKETMGNFMHYAVDPYGNVGSRAGARGNAPQTDPEKVRTIGFSEMFQHAGVMPTWLGAKTLAKNLCQEVKQQVPPSPGLNANYSYVKMNGDDFFVPNDGDIQKLDPAVYGVFYDKSAVFRNAVDGMAFGLAVSDLDGLRKNYPMLKDDPFVARMEEDYRAAAHIVLGALHDVQKPEEKTGTHVSRARKTTDPRMIALDPATPLPVLRDKIRERLPHLKQTIEHKFSLFDAVASMKSNWRRDWEWQEAAAKNETFKIPDNDNVQHGWMMHLAHGAIDSVTHSRYLMADDPMYMRMLYPEYHKARSGKRSLNHEQNKRPPAFFIRNAEPVARGGAA